MTIMRVQHNKNYTVINNTICKDKRLSWKAKGIWLYAFSRPDDWQFHVDDLINQTTDKRSAVNSGLRELEKAGYLRREQKRKVDGTMGNSEWCFHETPVELKKCLPQVDFPSTDYPLTDNQPLLSTEANQSNPTGSYRKGANLNEPSTESSPGPSSPPLSQKEKIKKEDTEAIQAFCLHNSLNIKLETLRKWHHKWGCDKINRNLVLLVQKIGEGLDIRSHERWMEAALKNDYGSEAENIELNQAWFDERVPYKFKAFCKCTKKYVKIPLRGREVLFNLNHQTFKEVMTEIIRSTR